MDFSFVDKYQEPTPPTAIDAQNEGYQKLVEVAQNIPLLTWNYNGVDVPDTGTKIGIITQALKKVDGLASMVSLVPIITVEITGLFYEFKTRLLTKVENLDDSIIDYEWEV